MSESNNTNGEVSSAASSNNSTKTNANLATTTKSLSPITDSERFGVMDALRGFALIGILMMNIEWFNRPTGELGQFDPAISGVDYAASWFVKVFIEGKIYKLFALLFGMGFAVMLLKAQQAQRPFNGMFIRRMLALFVFGMAHFIFLWDGDILHDYAIAGLLLLGWISLTKTKFLQRFSQPESFRNFGLTVLALPIVVSTIIGFGIGMTTDRIELDRQWSERQEIVSLANELTEKARLNSTAKKPVSESEKIEKDIGKSESSESPSKIVAEKPLEEGNNESINKGDATANKSDIEKVESTENKEAVKDDVTKEEEKDIDLMTREERISYLAEKRSESKIKREEKSHKEIAAVTDSNYLSGVVWRSQKALPAIGRAVMFSLLLLLPIFLLGYWLIASGVLKNAKNNMILFKSLAWLGMIFGFGITVASLTILQYPVTKETTNVNIVANMMFQFSQVIVTAGYLGVAVCMYQSERWRSRLDRLAPLGRMALTNYIMHTVILSTLFYGYGAGMFGQISRGPQLLVAIAIIIFQLILSKWWLNHYKFGPLEWFWRCLTYKKIQPMKLVKAN
ncbi:DUF418 domain-containing protein [Aliikangiella sp. IMCC44359]|uniref:DUF418 domain-containing protein n=1 Tax=Aliikangiella sp. IMCC44359 TaxID=3459125 RepID=UPI00403AFB28